MIMKIRRNPSLDEHLKVIINFKGKVEVLTTFTLPHYVMKIYSSTQLIIGCITTAFSWCHINYWPHLASLFLKSQLRPSVIVLTRAQYSLENTIRQQHSLGNTLYNVIKEYCHGGSILQRIQSLDNTREFCRTK